MVSVKGGCRIFFHVIGEGETCVLGDSGEADLKACGYAMVLSLQILGKHSRQVTCSPVRDVSNGDCMMSWLRPGHRVIGLI